MSKHKGGHKVGQKRFENRKDINSSAQVRLVKRPKSKQAKLKAKLFNDIPDIDYRNYRKGIE